MFPAVQPKHIKTSEAKLSPRWRLHSLLEPLWDFLPTSMPISKTRWGHIGATTILGIVYSTSSQCNAFVVHKHKASDTVILTRPTLVCHRSWWKTKSFLRAQRPRVNIYSAVNSSLGGLGSSCTPSSESRIYIFLWGPHASMCLCICYFIHKVYTRSVLKFY